MKGRLKGGEDRKKGGQEKQRRNKVVKKEGEHGEGRKRRKGARKGQKEK